MTIMTRVLRASVISLIALVATIIPVLAVDISTALYQSSFSTTNNAVAVTNLAVPFSLSGQALLDSNFITSNALNSVIHDISGSDIAGMPPTTNIAMLAAQLHDEGTGDTNFTAAANNNTVNDVQLLPASVAVNDAFYFGMQHQGRILVISLGTAGVGDWTILWEYWDGSTWFPLSNIDDKTIAFGVLGVGTVSFDRPDDWERVTFNSIEAFYVRARVTTVSTTTQQPIATRMWWQNGQWWTFVPALSINQQIQYTLYMGGAALVANHQIFLGDEGIITNDDADLELGNNYEVAAQSFFNITDINTSSNIVEDDFDDTDITDWSNTTDFEGSGSPTPASGAGLMRFKTDRTASSDTDLTLTGNNDATKLRFSLQISNDNALTEIQTVVRGSAANGPRVRLVGNGAGGVTLQAFHTATWNNIETALAVDTWYRIDLYEIDYTGTCDFSLARDGVVSASNPILCETNITGSDILRVTSASDVNAEFGAIDEILWQDRQKNIVYKPQALQVWMAEGSEINAEIWDGSSITELQISGLSPFTALATITLSDDATTITLTESGGGSDAGTSASIDDTATSWNWITNAGAYYTENITISFPEIDSTSSQAQWDAGVLSGVEASIGQPLQNVDFTTFVELEADDGLWIEGSEEFLESSITSFGYDGNGARTVRNSFYRFDGVQFTQGETVSQAFLTFIASGTTILNSVNVRITAEDVDDAVAPTSFAGVEATVRTTAFVDWNGVPDFVGLPVDSIDIAPVIQEIINRSGWVSGNAIMILVEDNGSTTTLNTLRDPTDYEGSVTAAGTKLTIIPTGVPSIPADFTGIIFQDSPLPPVDWLVSLSGGGGTGQVDVDIQSSDIRAGDFGLKTEWKQSQNSFSRASQDIVALPGQIWSGSVLGRRANSFDGRLEFKLIFLDSGLSEISNVSIAGVSGNVWTEGTLDNNTAPALTAFIRVELAGICNKSSCGSPREGWWDNLMVCICATAPDFPNAANLALNPGFEFTYDSSGTNTWISPTITFPTVTDVVRTSVFWSAITPSNTTLLVESSIDDQGSWQTVTTNGGSIVGVNENDDISSTNINIRFTYSTTDNIHTPVTGQLIVTALDDANAALQYIMIGLPSLTILDNTGGEDGLMSFPNMIPPTIVTLAGSLLSTATSASIQPSLLIPDVVSEIEGDINLFGGTELGQSLPGNDFFLALEELSGGDIPAAFFWYIIATGLTLVIGLIIMQKTGSLFGSALAIGFVLLIVANIGTGGIFPLWVFLFYTLSAIAILVFGRNIAL